ncbi:MAG TPA: protein-tyrosine phosphatase family protein [Rhabdochlamydiaceae bacterium]|jgi:protein tyrosine phosphatase|nr:protein-tyrosine phosphatase family protein [Rhabdochlamydiaceae bacterium]
MQSYIHPLGSDYRINNSPSTQSLNPEPATPTIPSFQPIVTNIPSYQIKQEYLDQYRDFEENQTNLPLSAYAKEALSHANLDRNRYKHSIPYQPNIFKFLNPALYFNASLLLQGRAIGCQGPLTNEHADFWRMVWESNTTAIVMLTDLVEKRVHKCSWYLPAESGAKLSPQSGFPKNLEITVTQTYGPPKPTSASTSNSIEFFQRRLELEHKDEKRTVVHYHLTGWSNFKASPHEILAQLVKLVWKRHFGKGERIISHCNTRAGRSGTFLAILEAFSQLKYDPVRPNVYEIAQKLRSCDKGPALNNLVLSVVRELHDCKGGREGMVKTADQYELIFKTLAVLDANCAREFCV